MLLGSIAIIPNSAQHIHSDSLSRNDTSLPTALHFVAKSVPPVAYLHCVPNCCPAVRELLIAFCAAVATPYLPNDLRRQALQE